MNSLSIMGSPVRAETKVKLLLFTGYDIVETHLADVEEQPKTSFGNLYAKPMSTTAKNCFFLSF